MADEPNSQVGQQGSGAQTSGAAGTPAGVTPTPAPAAAPTPASTPATPGLGREEISQIVSESVRAVTQQPKTMSQDELDKALRVFKPSAALIKKLRSENEEEAVQALNEIVQGTHTQATTLASYMFQMEMEKLQGQLNPLAQFVAEQRQSQLESEFQSKYPDLKDYRPLLLAVRDQLQREGRRFPNKEAAFEEIAKQARSMIATLPKAGAEGGGSGAPAASGTPPSHNMSSLTGGGQGGAGSNGGSPQAGPAWKQLFS